MQKLQAVQGGERGEGQCPFSLKNAIYFGFFLDFLENWLQQLLKTMYKP